MDQFIVPLKNLCSELNFQSPQFLQPCVGIGYMYVHASEARNDCFEASFPSVSFKHVSNEMSGDRITLLEIKPCFSFLKGLCPVDYMRSALTQCVAHSICVAHLLFHTGWGGYTCSVPLVHSAPLFKHTDTSFKLGFHPVELQFFLWMLVSVWAALIGADES